MMIFMKGIFVKTYIIEMVILFIKTGQHMKENEKMAKLMKEAAEIKRLIYNYKLIYSYFQINSVCNIQY